MLEQRSEAKDLKVIQGHFRVEYVSRVKVKADFNFPLTQIQSELGHDKTGLDSIRTETDDLDCST